MLRLPPFHLHVPRNVAEAVAAKGELGPRAVYLAGGTGLFPGMKRRQLEPEVVIPVQHLPELRAAGDANGSVRLGAARTVDELAHDSRIRKEWPALADACARVATPLVRNLATLGGNLCLDTRCSFYDRSLEWREAIDFCLKKDGDLCRVASSSQRCWAIQAGDLSPLVIALGARLELTGPEGSRTVPADGFYNDDGIRYLNKHRDELVAAVLLPREPGGESVYRKVSRRESFDFAVLSVAAWIRRESPEAEVTDARLVLGAVGSAPVVVPEAAAALVGRPLSEDTIRGAAEAAWKAARPLDNADQSGLWRKTVVRPYVVRTLRRLAGTAVRGDERGSR